MGTTTPVGGEPAARQGASLIPPRPTRVTAAETPRAAMASPVVVGATIIAALYFGREIFIPIAIAVLLSFVLTPLVNRLRRLRLPRLVAVGFSVLLTLGIVAAMATLIGIQAADLAGDVPRYRATIERKINGLRDSPVGHATEYVANIGRALHGGGKEVGKEGASAEAQAAPQPPQQQPAPDQAAPQKPMVVEVASPPPGPLAGRRARPADTPSFERRRRRPQRAEAMTAYAAGEGRWVHSIEDAPTYHPTPAEFAEPLRFIHSIQAVASKFGAPPSPPSLASVGSRR